VLLSQIQQAIKFYDDHKSFRRKILGDIKSIVGLKRFVTIFTENDVDHDIKFDEYLNFLKMNNIDFDFSTTYLNSGTLSANIFKKWIDEIKIIDKADLTYAPQEREEKKDNAAESKAFDISSPLVTTSELDRALFFDHIEDLPARFEKSNLGIKTKFNLFINGLNSTKQYNSNFSSSFVSPFTFPDYEKTPTTPISPKTIRKKYIDTPQVSDSKPSSIPLSQLNDPLNANIWSYIHTFLDLVSIAYSRQAGKFINIAPVFLELRPAIAFKKNENEYQLFLQSLPTPKVTYYSHASLFARENAITAEQRLPDLYYNSGDEMGFVIPGRKV
jgi:hypothetical protein